MTRGGRLPDPGPAAVCARCGESREAHGGPKNLGACPGESGLYARRFQFRHEDKPPVPVVRLRLDVDKTHPALRGFGAGDRVMTADLVGWLRAQLDEDERLAHEASRENPLYIPMCLHVPPEVAMHNAHHHPARVLVEVESKRRLIDDVLAYEAKIDGEWGCCHSAEDIGAGRCEDISPDEITALKLLALPYADRPGFKEGWRP